MKGPVTLKGWFIPIWFLVMVLSAGGTLIGRCVTDGFSMVICGEKPACT